MSTFTLAELQGLGDNLRVGPQWLRPATHGTPIVERGPHGMPLAPPLQDQEGNLRWWSENLYQPGQWIPRQAVVGVYGLGAGGLVVATANDKHRLTAQVDQVYDFVKNQTIPLTARRPAVQAIRSELAKYQAWQDSSWGLPFMGPGYRSKSDLIAKVGAAHNLVLVQDGRVDPSAVTASGAPRKDSPLGAAAQSLKEDYDQGTLVQVPDVGSFLPKVLGVGAAVVVVGAIGLAIYGYSKGAGSSSGRMMMNDGGDQSDPVRKRNPRKRRRR